MKYVCSTYLLRPNRDRLVRRTAGYLRNKMCVVVHDIKFQGRETALCRAIFLITSPLSNSVSPVLGDFPLQTLGNLSGKLLRFFFSEVGAGNVAQLGPLASSVTHQVEERKSPVSRIRTQFHRRRPSVVNCGTHSYIAVSKFFRVKGVLPILA